MAMMSMFFGLLASFFIYNDAKKRGYGAIMLLLWSIGSAIMPYVFVPIYLLFGRMTKEREQDDHREQYDDHDIIDIEATVVEETIDCMKCGRKINEEFSKCPYCQQPTGTSIKDD